VNAQLATQDGEVYQASEPNAYLSEAKHHLARVQLDHETQAFLGNWPVVEKKN
jgi:hypothetical protein